MIDFGRGIELGKDGKIARCPMCGKWNDLPKRGDMKRCSSCSKNFKIKEAEAVAKIIADVQRNYNDKPMVIGEQVNRYYTSGHLYINTSYDGINYKNPALYLGAKILFRKTGVGIYATIDYGDLWALQSVLVFRLKEELPERLKDLKLEYILGILNSRLMLYFYAVRFGNKEWRSFPQWTYEMVRALPIFDIDLADNRQRRIHDLICREVKKAVDANGPISTSVDLMIEDLVMDLYGITKEEKHQILEAIGAMQRLRIVRELLKAYEL